jgi:phosphatidylglycerol:prolipoprotein diacylglycerol transferase
MYPTLYHALLDLTGLDWPVLKFLNSFGFFVALAFMGAYWTLVLELKRKEGQGLIQATTRKMMVGEGAKPAELIMQGIVGFVVGWKGLYILLNTAEVTADPPAFLLSGTGNIIGGIIVAALFVWMLWREKEKHRLKEPKEETVTIHPAQHGGNITLTAACGASSAPRCSIGWKVRKTFWTCWPPVRSRISFPVSPCTAASS